MIVVANRFRIADGYETEFEDRFQNRRGAIEDQDGFVRFDLLRPAEEDTDTHVALTYWESREAFEAWTDSEAFADAHGGETPDGMFEGHPNLEVHEVVFGVPSE